MKYNSWKNYSSEPEGLLLHGTAVSVEKKGLLILGPSGSGKSRLALEMIVLGATLICDDRVWLKKAAVGLHLLAPDRLSGSIEARGLGLLSSTSTTRIPLAYCLDFSLENAERLPLISYRTKLGHPIHILPGRPAVPQAAALILLLKNGFAKND